MRAGVLGQASGGGRGDPRDRGRAIRVLRDAVDAGVQIIDTADSYGPGTSEQLIAEALSLRGSIAGALDAIERAADGPLTDVEWLEWCPALAPLRSEPRFVGVCERLRAENIALRQELASARNDAKRLNEKIEGARAKVEQLLTRLPE